MNHFMAVLRFEGRLISRNFLVVFFGLIFPILLIVLFGYIFGNQPSEQWGGYGMIDVSLPAYLGLSLAVSGILSFPLSISHYREHKVLKRFKATPLNPLTILGAQFLLNSILAIGSAIISYGMAKIFFDYKFQGSLVFFLLAYFLTLLSVFSLGLVIASIARRERTAEIVANMLFFVQIFLSGSTIPFEIMPTPLQKILEIVPLTHGIILLKMSSLNTSMPDYLYHISILGMVSIIGVFISQKSFRWE